MKNANKCPKTFFKEKEKKETYAQKNYVTITLTII